MQKCWYYYSSLSSCIQTNQVCTYKYAAEQQQFGEGRQQAIAVGAVVEVSCSSGMPDLSNGRAPVFSRGARVHKFFAHYIDRPVSICVLYYFFVLQLVYTMTPAQLSSAWRSEIPLSLVPCSRKISKHGKSWSVWCCMHVECIFSPIYKSQLYLYNDHHPCACSLYIK